MIMECTLNKNGRCPNCNTNWDGGAIFDSFRHQAAYRTLNDAELCELISEFYGNAAERWSRLVGIEIQGRYDGVSLWQCPDCQHTWDADSVQFLTSDDEE